LSEYKRFVSYIYEYVQGEKRESLGFVKVNARDGICKIQIHMRGFYTRGQAPYEAYVFTQKKERLTGQLLGELESKNGALEWSGVTESEDLMKSGFGLEESQGIYIEGDNHIYAAQWDDFPVDVERFEPLRRSVRQTVGAESEGAAPKEKREKEEVLQAAEVIAEYAMQETAESEESQKKPDSRQEQWEYLTKHFPVMQYVDGDGAVMSSIRLDPQSLTRVPRDKWELGNNSFLLHGIYHYRHLLLLRRQTEENITYYIGVPGVYSDQEQMMASMFGFQEFRMLKEPGARKRSFGYWCRTLGE
jgi:hypothetical protein